MMRKIGMFASVAALCLASLAHAGQYTNADGSTSPGVVMEMGGKPAGLNNAPIAADPEFASALAQVEFNASIPMQANGSGSFLSAELCNKAASGKLLVIIQRRFDNNVVSGQVPMEYYGVSNPGAIANPSVTSTGTNLYGGAPTSAAATFTAAVSTTAMSGTTVAGGALPTGGDPLLFQKTRPVPPGTCFGQVIVGQNQPSGLNSVAARASTTFFWIERPYP